MRVAAPLGRPRMPDVKGVLATLLLAVPAGTLGGLAGFAMTRPDDARAACVAWATAYRAARDDVVAADRRWWAAHGQGIYQPPDKDGFRARAAELYAAQPPRCTINGHLIR